MPDPYSEDFCEKVIIKYHWLDQDVRTIAEHLVCDYRTVNGILERWERGEELELDGRKGSLNLNRKCSTEMLNLLLAIVRAEETIYLDEIADILHEWSGEHYSLATVCRGLQELGWTRKKAWQDPLSCICRLARTLQSEQQAS